MQLIVTLVKFSASINNMITYGLEMIFPMLYLTKSLVSVMDLKLGVIKLFLRQPGCFVTLKRSLLQCRDDYPILSIIFARYQPKFNLAKDKVI